MPKHRRVPAEQPSSRERIAANLGRAYWSVEDDQWGTVHPGMPAEVAELVASPIVVGAVPVTGTRFVATAPVAAASRLTVPVVAAEPARAPRRSGRHRRNSGPR
ncbi:hypothetical protein [Melissospora conviva]|uniref:hypothetical protein n=1 Tax=Melissospora conviva TaxID=3388432 RepID=UPI003B78C80A